MKYTTTIELRGGDAEIVVEYDYYKGDPGRYYGRPELCYPEEPAHVEIIAVTYGGVTITDNLSQTQLESLEQEIMDDITAAEELAMERRDEWAREERQAMQEARE